MDQQDRMLFPMLFLLFQVLLVAAQTSSQDFSGLQSLTEFWTNKPPNWAGSDPCGGNWDGIVCTNTRITQLKLSSLALEGQLSSAIQSLSQLDTLDLSYNSGLTGTIPKEIGNLARLKSLALVGCSFYGPIPDSIGFLTQLTFLGLNSNRFNGSIPRSIGNLSNLNWLDISDNQLRGPIPVSDDQGQLGLDMLLKAQHFHMGDNKLSGQIPPKLFNSSMILVHVLFYGNQLVGTFPSTLSLVSTVEVVRFDKNGLTGEVPSNIKNLGQLSELYLSDNNFNGSLPNLSGMNGLTYVDLSNNSFTSENIPSWVTSLEFLTTAMLGDNQLNGTFNISNGYSTSLQLVNLQNNAITDYKPGNQKINFEVVLAGNPFCLENGVSQQSYCQVLKATIPSYSTPLNNCSAQTCSNSQILSPNCKCAYPYIGSLVSRSIGITIFNTSDYKDIEKSLLDIFRGRNLPVDSVSLSNPMKNSFTDNFQFTVSIFPSQTDRFNRSGLSQVAFVLSNQIYKAPKFFAPYFFIGNDYGYYGGEPKNSSSHTGVIVGAVLAVVVFLVLAVLAGIYAIRQNRRAQRIKEQNPFVNWEQNKDNGSAPQLKGARWFSFDELRKYTNNFAEANTIGSGGYGQVYQGVLPGGELVAIKRAAKESMQGAAEFKTEIELLSRVHHKNLVSLVGFCFEKGEQMLVYEYISNGSLLDSLTGKSGIWMDWIRRLKVTLGSAKGLTYLHELANPRIIHRDIKSGNILLDSHLNAKVADFGLSKLLSDNEESHITTQVKGTMGYLDPEYYMTQQLTEKSDVYSFGVLMLELVTARRPIEKGKFIVREVTRVMDKSKDLYNLHSLLDPTIIKETKPKGLEKFVELALRCAKENGQDRPSMSDVVKEVENILELVGLNPNAESASTSEAYDVEKGGDVIHPYGNEDFSYSGVFPSAKVEPQ